MLMFVYVFKAMNTFKYFCSFNRDFKVFLRVGPSGPHLEFEDEVTSLQLQVNKLQTLGVNKIIALGHSGFTVDREIAKKVRGVDVVIGGHTNTFLFTGAELNTDVNTTSVLSCLVLWSPFLIQIQIVLTQMCSAVSDLWRTAALSVDMNHQPD